MTRANWVKVTIPAYEVEVRDWYWDIDEMAEDNRKLGQHWFDKDTMKYFKTRIYSSVRAGRYFITSEKRGWNDEARAYTIRECVLGKVDTVGEFLAYPTLAKARKALNEIIKAQEVTA